MSKRLSVSRGDVFNMLTVIKEQPSKRLPSGQINRIFNCKCECGIETNVRIGHLVRGKISSCGCIQKKQKGKGGTLLCKVWRQMKSRCLDTYRARHLYFDKGIKVCDEWMISYESFMKWSIKNGYKEGLQIDRRDNSKGYCPKNCRWVVPRVNCNNRDNTFMINYNQEKQSLSMVLFNLGKLNSYASIRGRILRGWDHQKAVDHPIKIGNYSKKK